MKNLVAGELLAMCYDRQTGDLNWKRKAGSGYRPGNQDGFDYQLDSRSNYASPSPVTDGKRVVFFYGNGDLVSYLINGSEEWRRNIQQDYGDFCFQWTFSSSPTLFKNKLYLPVLQRNEVVHGRGKISKSPLFFASVHQRGRHYGSTTDPPMRKRNPLSLSGQLSPLIINFSFPEVMY
jgi:hypothetical protein